MSFNYRSIALLTSITLLLTLLTTRIDVKLYRFINHRISSITFIPTYSPLKEISAVNNLDIIGTYFFTILQTSC